MDMIGAIWIGAAVLFGLIIGSFLNVVIVRLPLEQSIVHPRSRCPKCRTDIAWYDNIPIVSYLILGATCRTCDQSIAWRYPFVEALNALLYVGLLCTVGPGLQVVVLWVFTSALVASTFIDFDHRIIPDEITLPGMVLGLGVSTLLPSLHGVETPLQGFLMSLLGLVVGGGSLYATGILGNVLFHKESMGGGDIKLLAFAGSVLGWELALLTFFVAPVLALLPGVIVLMTSDSHEIPYGPFLSLALVIVMLWGDTIARWFGITELIALGVPELLRTLSRALSSGHG
jgi:leader peptidase (prepilin peptidase) / N-methyltransferase